MIIGRDPEDAPLGTYTYRCKGCNGKYCNVCNFGDMWEPAILLHRAWEDITATDDRIRACDGEGCNICAHKERCKNIREADCDKIIKEMEDEHSND